MRETRQAVSRQSVKRDAATATETAQCPPWFHPDAERVK